MDLSPIRWEPTLPNKLTFSRIVLVIPIMLAYQHGMRLVALLLFLCACVTDLLDGWLARRLHCQSAWGHLADPMADKLVCTAAMMICFFQFGGYVWYTAPALVIVGYDIVVIWMRSRVRLMQTNQWARRKTAFLMFSLIGGMLAVALGDLAEKGVTSIPLIVLHVYSVGAAFVGMWVAALLVLVSASTYLSQHAQPIRVPEPAE